jgi:hypothetical protein
MVRTKTNQFGILWDLKKAITHYTGIRVIIRSLGDAITILFENEKDTQCLTLPKKDGHVEDQLFEEAVNFLQGILNESVA